MATILKVILETYDEAGGCSQSEIDCLFPSARQVSAQRDTDANNVQEVLQPNSEEARPQLINPTYPDELEPGTYPEGLAREVLINEYERSSFARQRCIDHYGVKCQVCKIDFEEKYGPIGRGFIHVHHLVPLATIGKQYFVDPIADLRPVCPNCHAMLHRSDKVLLIEELRSILNDG